jgi:hypothetical protein
MEKQAVAHILLDRIVEKALPSATTKKGLEND